MAYIGRQNLGGAYRQLDDISSSFNGSTTAFTMQVNSTNVSLGDVNQIVLSLGGVVQKPGTDFTISGSTLTFTTAPAANTSFFAILLGSDNGGTVTPTDVSVTKAKLADEIDIFAGTSLSAADLGAGVHIKTGDSGASVDASADELVIESSGNAGMTIASGASNNGIIYFADSGSTYDGYINYSQNTQEMTLATAQTAALVIDADGQVLKPKQPAFLVKPSSTQTDFNQGQVITIDFGTEVFDVGSNFASNTFTAPVTGKYALQFAIQINDISNQDSSTYYYIEMNTSNRPYYNLSSIDQAVGSSAGQYYFTLAASVTADMDANDTVTCRVVQGGTSGVGPSDISNNSHFSGFLVC